MTFRDHYLPRTSIGVIFVFYLSRLGLLVVLADHLKYNLSTNQNQDENWPIRNRFEAIIIELTNPIPIILPTHGRSGLF